MISLILDKEFKNSLDVIDERNKNQFKDQNDLGNKNNFVKNKNKKTRDSTVDKYYKILICEVIKVYQYLYSKKLNVEYEEKFLNIIQKFKIFRFMFQNDEKNKINSEEFLLSLQNNSKNSLDDKKEIYLGSFYSIFIAIKYLSQKSYKANKKQYVHQNSSIRITFKNNNENVLLGDLNSDEYVNTEFSKKENEIKERSKSSYQMNLGNSLDINKMNEIIAETLNGFRKK